MMAARITSAERMRRHREAFALGVAERLPLRVAEAVLDARRASERHAAAISRLNHRRAQHAARAAASTPTEPPSDARWMLRD